MISCARMWSVRNLLVLSLPLAVYAGKLPVQRFTTAEGLPRNALSCLTPGRTGVMWMCSTEGLIRFDGSGFRVFGPDDGLPSRVVVHAIASKSGGYWLITPKGVCKLETTARISEPCKTIPGSVPPELSGASILESSTGKTWFGTGHRVFEILQSPQGGRTLRETRFESPGRCIIESLADGENGGLYVGTAEGLFEFRESGQPQQAAIDSESGIVLGIEDMLRLPDGTMWLATTSGPVKLIPGAPPKMRLISKPDVRTGQVILRKDGRLWFAADTGLIQIDPSTNGRVDLTPQDGLPRDFIEFIAEDSYGDLWGTTAGSGIFRLENSGIRAYYGSDGLGGPRDAARISAVFEDRKGRLCVLTSWDGGSLRVFTDNAFRLVTIPYPKGFTGYGWGSKQFGFQAHDGEWWVPSGGGLLRFTAADIDDLPKARLKARYDDHSSLHCQDVVRAFEDSSGDVWAACLYPEVGFARWSRESDEFHIFGSTENWDPKAMVTLIREPHPGEIWAIAQHTFSRLRNGHFETFPIDESAGIVQDALFDSAGRMWVATSRAGLLRCDRPNAAQPEFQPYTVREGLSVNSVRSLALDRQGFLYAGTVRGVDRIDPGAPVTKQYIRHFTVADGLPNSENNVAFTDSGGRIWFGTLGGLAELNPSQVPKLGPPSVFLTQVRVRGEEIPLEWEGATKLTLSLASDRNQLEVTFSGTDSRPMASLRYQYRLVGVDHDWSPPTERSTVNYSALPSGTLRFEVRSFNADGLVSASVAGIDLDIAAPIWRRAWFLALIAVLIGGALYAIDQYRLRQVMAIERLRLRIATELHDDIGANLSQIAILTEVARRDGAKATLAEVPVIARETVELMSDIVWAVNPHHDGFDALLHRMRRFASDTLGAADIQLEFSTPEGGAGFNMPLETRRPIYLVFKEAINNIAKHSAATAASVRFRIEGSMLVMEIGDNGRGFDRSQQSEGDGLSNMIRRMRESGGQVAWETGLGEGTKITAKMPLG